MGAFGDNLRRERELRGVSLVEISSATKIGARMLDAIETERFERLPGGVFNAAFVRQYARYLGLNEDRVVAEFLAACTSCAPPEPQKDAALMALRQMATAESQRSSSGLGARPLPAIIAMALLATGALAVGGWRIWHGAPSEAPKKVVAKTAPPVTPPANQPAPNPQADTAPVVEDDVAQPSVMTLDLAAKDRCTIEVSIDGRPQWRAVMGPGTHRNLKAGRTVQLTVDNAAALIVTRNGETLPPLGDAGESKTLNYRADRKP